MWYGVAWWYVVWYGMWCGMVVYGGMACGVVWYGMLWYGVVWGGMVWFSMVCVVWCGMENRGLPESAPHESSGAAFLGDRTGIAVRV